MTHFYADDIVAYCYLNTVASSDHLQCVFGIIQAHLYHYKIPINA